MERLSWEANEAFMTAWGVIAGVGALEDLAGVAGALVAQQAGAPGAAALYPP